MDERKLSPWQATYRAALQESEPEKLRELVLAAEAAIFVRLQKLEGAADTVEHQEERGALKEAIDSLYVLKIQKLKYPDWKP